MRQKNVFNLQQEGIAQDLVVILESKWSVQYEASRAISNSKFYYRPSGIAYCKNVGHVQFCVNFCRNNDIMFRIRSGGHQHEGMSSGNNVLIIDLSEIHDITYIDGKDEAWIPAGKQLQYVYQELEAKDYIIPGGGCQSVNVGGLTQGGGWGAHVRKLGLTCDNILEVEMVLANGQVVYPSATNFPDLFWGLKGGGGGNFGVVTRFKFKLTRLEVPMTSFTLEWKKEEEAKPGILKWMAMQRDLEHDRNLSSFCRMSVEEPTSKGEKNTVLSRMGGLYYGTQTDLENLLKKYFGDLFHAKCFKANTKYFGDKDMPVLEKFEAHEASSSSAQVSSYLSLADAQKYLAEHLNPVNPFPTEESLSFLESTKSDEPVCPPIGENLPTAPSITCDRPHPHKVTSTFPVAVNSTKEAELLDKEMTNRIHDYLTCSCYYKDVSRYMSFHCLGGAVTDHPTERAFPYAKKPYMLQVQTWWNLSENKSIDDKRKVAYDKWVEDFRTYLHTGKTDKDCPKTPTVFEGNCIEGAFINFVDKDIFGPYRPEKRHKILTAYYTEKNLKKLMVIKNKYDPYNLFDFRLSIPLD